MENNLETMPSVCRPSSDRLGQENFCSSLHYDSHLGQLCLNRFLTGGQMTFVIWLMFIQSWKSFLDLCSTILWILILVYLNYGASTVFFCKQKQQKKPIYSCQVTQDKFYFGTKTGKFFFVNDVLLWLLNVTCQSWISPNLITFNDNNN